MWRSDCVKEVTWLEEKLRVVFLLKQSTPGSVVPLAMFAFNVSCYKCQAESHEKEISERGGSQDALKLTRRRTGTRRRRRTRRSTLTRRTRRRSMVRKTRRRRRRWCWGSRQSWWPVPELPPAAASRAQSPRHRAPENSLVCFCFSCLYVMKLMKAIMMDHHAWLARIVASGSQLHLSNGQGGTHVATFNTRYGHL